MSDVRAGPFGPLNVGEVAKPPFAVLPHPSELFKSRSDRFKTLSDGHQLKGYLELASEICALQHRIVPEFTSLPLPAPDQLAQAHTHAMPPLGVLLSDPTDDAVRVLDVFLDGLPGLAMPEATSAAVKALRDTPRSMRAALLGEALDDPAKDADLAQHTLVLAALEIYATCLAAQLDPDSLTRIADAICPACGQPPVASAIVSWPSAHNTRFCQCSLCNTMWNAVRAKCLICGEQGGISFLSLGGETDPIKAETCGACRSSIKVMYQTQDPALDLVADDVASLGLDILLAEKEWRRAGRNRYLLGY
jgi:FdhE protein